MFCLLIRKSLLDPPPTHYFQSLATLPGVELLLVFLPRVQGHGHLCQQAFQMQNRSCPTSNPHLDPSDYRPPTCTPSRVRQSATCLSGFSLTHYSDLLLAGLCTAPQSTTTAPGQHAHHLSGPNILPEPPLATPGHLSMPRFPHLEREGRTYGRLVGIRGNDPLGELDCFICHAVGMPKSHVHYFKKHRCV